LYASLFLTNHFTLAELTRTSCKIANAPSSPVVLANLRSTCLNILEPVRKHFQRPIVIHSGYRCRAVNSAVGGSKTSQHCKGEAVDFHVSGYSVYEVAGWIKENISYDQLILENFVPGIKTSGWVHCSLSKENRDDERTKFKGSSHYYPGILLRP
jgi:zinc D-Ala-D-Ala carboxypeptidase